MRTIRDVREDELAEFLRITVEAFPGMKVVSPEDKERMHERLAAVSREPIVHFVAVYEDEQMVGIMRMYDFTMKLRSARTLVGGVGGVAVDLRRKKEKVAADLIGHFLRHYRERGAAMTALYPFRPDFYRRMGFGYGSKMYRYSFLPGGLHHGRAKSHIVNLTADDKADVAACYDRFLERTNGLIELPPHVLSALFSDPALKMVGYRANGRLEGYLLFRFEPLRDDNFLQNNLVIRALVYDHTAALTELLTYLHTQADQVSRVIYETQDENFYHLLQDPRDGSDNLLAGLWHQTNTQGLGIMYRVVDVRRLFEVLAGHDFGGQSVRLRLTVDDTFLPENRGSYLLDVEAGRARLLSDGAADAEVSLGISEFSSLMAGSVGFRALVEYGLATLSEPRLLETVDRLFHAPQRPICMTNF